MKKFNYKKHIYVNAFENFEGDIEEEFDNYERELEFQNETD